MSIPYDILQNRSVKEVQQKNNNQRRTYIGISIIIYYYYLATEKIAKKLFLNTFKKFLKTVKNTRRFDVLGRHYQVKKKQYEYSINTRKTIVH